MATIATSATPVAVLDAVAHTESASHKPRPRAIVYGIALAIPLWGLVIWGVRALFF